MTSQSSFSVYSYADNSYTGTLQGADPGFQTSSTYDPLGGSLPTGGSASYSIGPGGSSYATSSQGIAAIDGLFSAILIRAPTAAELSAAQSYLASGATLGALRAAIAFGGAGTIAVQSVIQNVLGRSATASDTAWIQANQQYLAGGGTLAQVISALALGSGEVSVLDNVIQNVLGRSATAADGHVDMWDGKNWVSDYVQSNIPVTNAVDSYFSPLPGHDWINANPSYQIYRQ